MKINKIKKNRLCSLCGIYLNLNVMMADEMKHTEAENKNDIQSRFILIFNSNDRGVIMGKFRINIEFERNKKEEIMNRNIAARRVIEERRVMWYF